MFSLYRENTIPLLVLSLNVIIVTLLYTFYDRWKALREKMVEETHAKCIKNNENFLALRDFDRGRGPQNRYLRLPFLHYRFLGSGIGFVEIGDFMMQWGTVHGDENFITFADKFRTCCGCVCTPAIGGGGQFSICVRSLHSNGFDVYAAGYERPFYYMAYGSRYRYEDE